MSTISHATAPTRSQVPLPLTVAAFTANFDRFAITPILVIVAAAMRTGLSSVVTLASGYTLAYGLSQPAWGILSDRIGRIPAIRAALTLATLAAVASAAAADLTALVALRFVAGFAFGGIVPTALSFVGDTVAPETRQAALADLMAALALGSAIAVLAAGVLGSWLTWRLVFAVPAVPAMAAVIGLHRTPEPQRRSAGRVLDQLGTVLREKYTYVVVALGTGEGAVLLGGMTFVAPALEHRGLAAAIAGAITAGYGLMTLVASQAVKILATRAPAHALAAIGGAFVTIGYAMAAVSPGVGTYAALAGLLGAGWAFLHSTMQTWATSAVPQARGTAVSCYVAALFVGASFGAWLGGVPAEHARFGMVFGCAAMATVPLCVTIVAARSRFAPAG